jgi:hypothetical protein
MTKKDYIALARIISLTNVRNDAIFMTALVQHLKVDNANFDAEKFLKACGC